MSAPATAVVRVGQGGQGDHPLSVGFATPEADPVVLHEIAILAGLVITRTDDRQLVVEGDQDTIDLLMPYLKASAGELVHRVGPWASCCRCRRSERRLDRHPACRCRS